MHFKSFKPLVSAGVRALSQSFFSLSFSSYLKNQNVDSKFEVRTFMLHLVIGRSSYPSGTTSRAHSSTSRIFFGYACQRARDLVLLYATCCPSLLRIRIRSQRHSSCVPTFKPNPNPEPNPESRPSTRLGPLSSATHNSDRSGENLRLITRPSVCRNCLLPAEPG